MSYSNGKISETDPVTIADVQNALSSTSNDVGALCASSSVNLWAKYKPVVLGDIVPVRSGEWWKGTSGKCGLNIYTYSSLVGLFTDLAEGTYAWGREEVTGGTTAPYRLLDFQGYNHNAVNPVGDIGATSYTISSGSITISYDIEAVGDDNLTLSDIDIDGVSLDNFYLGVYCFDGSGSTSSFYCTSSEPFTSSTDMSMELTGLTDSYAGSYTVIPFFSSVQLALNGEASSGTFLSANKAGVTITINSTGTLYYLTAMGNWADEDFTSVYWAVLGTNTGTTSYTFTYSVYLYRKTADQEYSAGELVRSLVTNQSVTLAAGASNVTVYEDTNAVSGYDYSYEYYLAVVSEAAQTTTTYYPLEDYYPE